MGNLNKRLREYAIISTYCWSKPNGSGMVNKKECECFSKKGYCCQAYKDKERFHSHFEHLRSMSFADSVKERAEIIKKIRDEFKDSQWYKDNVVE